MIRPLYKEEIISFSILNICLTMFLTCTNVYTGRAAWPMNDNEIFLWIQACQGSPGSPSMSRQSMVQAVQQARQSRQFRKAKQSKQSIHARQFKQSM